MTPASAKRCAAFLVIAATSGSTGVMPRSRDQATRFGFLPPRTADKNEIGLLMATGGEARSPAAAIGPAV